MAISLLAVSPPLAVVPPHPAVASIRAIIPAGRTRRTALQNGGRVVMLVFIAAALLPDHHQG
jgi:hypothetical protein